MRIKRYIDSSFFVFFKPLFESRSSGHERSQNTATITCTNPLSKPNNYYSLNNLSAAKTKNIK